MRRRMLMGKQGRLPYPYQEVEYIKGNGTQYIDTGIVPQIGCSVEASFNTMEYAVWETLFGCKQSSPALSFVFQIGNYKFYASTKANGFYPANVTFNSEYDIKLECLIDKTKVTINSTVYENGDSTELVCDKNIFIGATNNNGTPADYWKNVIKKWKYSLNGEVLRELIPCYDSTDTTKHTAGLYDIVNNQFYANAGTGYFIVGPDV